jgi:hypothetical protein
MKVIPECEISTVAFENELFEGLPRRSENGTPWDSGFPTFSRFLYSHSCNVMLNYCTNARLENFDASPVPNEYP